MDSRSITRLMIDAAVERGIKEMAEDPRRTLRKLADMGKQFSTGRFQSQTFDIIQTLLENDDSPYYELIERVLKNTDHRILKRFGINMGYGSWTYGAREIRRISEQMGFQVPWLIIMHYHPSVTGAPGMDADAIRDVIKQALPFGINTFAVFRDSALTADRELLDVFGEFPECGFFYFLPDAEITAAQANRIKTVGNTLVVVDADEADTKDTCHALRDAGLLFAAYHIYDSYDAGDPQNESLIREYLKTDCGMFFFIQGRDSAVSAGESVKRARMEQKYPCFLWDLYSDVRAIGNILCAGNELVEFAGDGSVIRPLCAGENILLPGTTLKRIFENTAAPIPEMALAS